MGVRLERINSLIAQEVAELLREEFPPEEVGWISVTGVKTAPDLSEAVVFVSVFPEEAERKALEALTRRSGLFRRHLAKKLRTKTVPRLRFEVDALTKLMERGAIKPPEGD
ncbi:MAG: 30S ribosome-binding factor RbfA [Aquificae bacterium]|nr:30S ribosome-binding factor RbfA [Aquificota bacterium]